MEYAKGLNIDISERAISPLKLLWVALADFQNEKTGQCNPSIKTLARCIEKSESQTTLYMGMLKRLGLVIASKNAKGGRFTPQYELPIPCHPMDKEVNTPMGATPQIPSETTPPAEGRKGSYRQDPTPPIDRTRILIEPLDEPLIKSFINERNIYLKKDSLLRLAHKYKYPFKPNTALHDVENWLASNLSQSTLHKTKYETH
jgi:hypothetical protein